jgi:hypothetical protein
MPSRISLRAIGEYQSDGERGDLPGKARKISDEGHGVCMNMPINTSCASLSFWFIPNAEVSEFVALPKKLPSLSNFEGLSLSRCESDPAVEGALCSHSIRFFSDPGAGEPTRELYPAADVPDASRWAPPRASRIILGARRRW